MSLTHSMKLWFVAASGSLFVVGLMPIGCGGVFPGTTVLKADLGKDLFFDTTLSSPGGQSCATCHVTSTKFTDSRGTVTSEGVLPGIFGNRQTPSAMYMQFSPVFGFDADAQDYIGGQFWDGRAATLEEQAKGPFLNPGEMHNSTKLEVVTKVMTGAFAEKFKAVFGQDIFNDTDRAYNALAEAIAAFERTDAFHPFSSKYDLFLKNKLSLTAEEMRGLAIFEDPAKGNCAACHPNRPGPNGQPPLFTDFSYDNIGLPKNPLNPFYAQPIWHNPAGASFIDVGLSATTGRPDDIGRFKVPTLRNIAATAPYFHNGVFTTLEDVVQFYNERDLGGFNPPEVPTGVNHDELGNLHLTTQEKADLVTFLGTLTDGYDPAH